MTRTYPTTWSADLDAIVHDWAGGAITMADAIARTGRTRNAIIGRSNRLGLTHVGRADSTRQRRLIKAERSPDVGCAWPEGDPLMPDFRFCGAARAGDPRAPYCAEHVAKAFAPLSSLVDRARQQRQARQRGAA